MQFVKDVIEGSHLEPSVLCAVRYCIVAAIMLPTFIAPGLKKVNWNLSLELGFLLAVAFECQSRELVTESASQGSIALAVYIMLVPVVELFFGRRFNVKKGLSLGVAVAGIALLAVGAQRPPRDTASGVLRLTPHTHFAQLCTAASPVAGGSCQTSASAEYTSYGIITVRRFMYDFDHEDCVRL